MKQFLRMIELVKTSGILYLDSGKEPIPRVDPSHFWEVAEICQPFVFTIEGETKVPPEIIDEAGNTLYKTFDAPFPVFSIEILNGDVTVPSFMDAFEDRQFYTHCILVWEIEPRRYAYYVLGTVDTGGRVKTFVYQTRTLDALVEAFVDRINSQACGTEKVRERVKIGTGKTKKIHTIRQIVHVRPKSKRPERTEESGREIDWSHRWWRRGHWRQTAKLGKNREGVYCVEGFTWVSEHEVGPDDKPLIRKTRIVDETNT